MESGSIRLFATPGHYLRQSMLLVLAKSTRDLAAGKEARLLDETRQETSEETEQLDERVVQDFAFTRSTNVEDTIFVSIDVEKNERGFEVLEIGLASVRIPDTWFFPPINSHHLVLEEHRHIHNRRPG